MTTSYIPKIDVTPELNDANASYYQLLVGILRCIVDFVRVDKCLEVSMMSLYLALPRIVHLHQVIQIFAHLKKYHNAELVYDHTSPENNKEDFEAR